MSADDESTPTKRGEASDRIIRALVAEFPRVHNRQTFVDSDSLRQRFGKGLGQRLSEKEQRAVSKTLGRLIGDRTVCESLWLRGDDSKVALGAAGLIAVSVDIASLRQAWTEWDRSRRVGPDETAGDDSEPTQELVANEIIARSSQWISDNGVDGRLPLALINVSIIHGSNAFDILITATYGEARQLLRYTREVVQRVPHISGTHTMQIAQSYGFPNLTGAEHGD